MNTLENFLDSLEQKRPVEWDKLPDIELYMDQLLTYVNRQQSDEVRDVDLTKSMVNNYIKQGIVQKPLGKRYAKEHIAELTMLTLLKEVLPMQQCQELFQQIEVATETEAVYEDFLHMLDSSITKVLPLLQDFEDDRQKQVLYFALLSYTCRKVAMKLLLSGQEEEACGSRPSASTQIIHYKKEAGKTSNS